MSLTAAKEHEQQLSFARHFPLPLTPFESFMLADSRPAYPMMCELEMEFEGCIDREAFDAALAFAMSRAPLFRSHIEQSRRGHAWVLSDQEPEVDWAPWGTPRGPRFNAPIDLAKEIGLRVWVRYDLDRSSVLLHFHHACSDGIGGVGFVEDFLVGYARAFPETGPLAVREISPDRLLVRGELGAGRTAVYRGWHDAYIGVRESIRYFLQNARPLPRASDPAKTRLPAQHEIQYLTRRCTDEVAVGLRKAATDQGATANDILIRDLFVALRTWNEEQGQPLGRKYLRILVPQSLREKEDAGLPAANKLGFVFLTRRANRCDRPDELLHSIQEETQVIRQGQLSRYFIGGLSTMRKLRILNAALRSGTCFSTVVLTNLSDPTRRFVARLPRTKAGLVAGNLVYTGLVGTPPLRPKTGGAFCVFNSARTLAVTLKCDTAGYTLDDTQRLLSCYFDQLQATATPYL